MNKDELRTLILKASKSIPNRVEFDAKIIQELLEERFDEEVSLVRISKNLLHMNFSRRNLTLDETQRWRMQFGSQPKMVYMQHGGQNPNNYEKGVGTRKPRPLISELQVKEEWLEECAVCPEFDECQGIIRPCPRFSVKATAPRDRVMRLEDFE